MKNLSSTQIETIKGLTAFYPCSFHGNRKQINGLPIDIYKAIIHKKRERSNIESAKLSDVQKVKGLLSTNADKDSPYFKVMIEGETGIYLACPVHRHKDYNKARLFDKTERTLKLMQLFNKIVTR
jgi:hypothetical protein